MVDTMARNKKTRNQKQKAAQQKRAEARRQAAATVQGVQAQQESAGGAGAAEPSTTNRAKSNTFLADHRKERAAQLLAEKDISATDIATAIGIARSTLWEWQQEPDFSARVAEHTKALADASQQLLIARRTYRLGNLQERLLRMQRLLDARADDPELQAARGGDTGLLVKQARMIGSGDNARLITEFEFDAALEKAMRDTEKQAAQECGDWMERQEIKGSMRLEVTVEETIAARRKAQEHREERLRDTEESADEQPIESTQPKS